MNIFHIQKPNQFNPDYAVGVDAEAQDYDLVRLEGFEGHIYKVIWPKSLKVLMSMGLCFCAASYCIFWVKR